MDPGVYRMVFILGTEVQYVCAGEKLMVANFIAFDVEALHAEVED